MRTTRFAHLVCVLSCILPACAVETQMTGEPVGETQQAQSIARPSPRRSRARDLSGAELNGRSLNGTQLTEQGIVGVSLENVRHDDEVFRAVWLNATAFGGLDASGHKLGKRDIVGAQFDATIDDGSTLPVRIDSMRKGTDAGMRDLTEYAVSYLTDAGWKPLCGLDSEGEPVRAIPLSGVWDYAQGVSGGGSHTDTQDSFTFACRGFVITKCVEYGYRPWESVRVCRTRRDCSFESLADHHQACTRALRADYCGDGASHTVDGTAINLYDGWGVRTDDEAWLPEAEWTADGARCVARARIPALPTPACFSTLQQDDCGNRAHFITGTLLVTEDTP